MFKIYKIHNQRTFHIISDYWTFRTHQTEFLSASTKFFLLQTIAICVFVMVRYFGYIVQPYLKWTNIFNVVSYFTLKYMKSVSFCLPTYTIEFAVICQTPTMIDMLTRFFLRPVSLHHSIPLFSFCISHSLFVYWGKKPLCLYDSDERKSQFMSG